MAVVNNVRNQSIGRQTLLEMFRKMILIRQFDERAIQLRIAGKIYGTLHPYVGQEAVAVGVCTPLHATDRVTSTHRGHGHCIAKGADPRRMMAELFGRIDGYCKGRGGSMHIADFSIGMLGANGIVGGGLPLAAGAALAAQIENQGRLAVCFFGDGATATGIFHETLNISALWRLPVVFVCENNLYASNNRVDAHRAVTAIALQATAYGIPGTTVDGNDVVAVFEATQQALDRARRREGPTLLECQTYRWRFHSMRQTPPPDQRPADEIAVWKTRDPIARLEARLMAEGLLDEFEATAIRQGVERELDESEAFAERSRFPEAHELLDDLYAS
jgi:TPP-dependent pyruvate/acetoin dehydrogenase alpha subunit